MEKIEMLSVVMLVVPGEIPEKTMLPEGTFVHVGMIQKISTCRMLSSQRCSSSLPFNQSSIHFFNSLKEKLKVEAGNPI